eukprot:GHVO01004788.1.p1 GENE.GHVO01004788.1~~GHVO01004788.1.p1  ORF type:complete len:390 (+),score=6.48 GHVO01004788.1:223-1392(+)
MKKVCSLLAVAVFLTISVHLNFQNMHKKEVSLNKGVSLHPRIHMLSWTAETMFTKVGENQSWFSEYGPNPMDVCYEVYNLDRKYECTYTNDKEQLTSADVVLFRGRRLERTPLPTYRRSDQSWIFFEFEPPFKVWKGTNLTRFNGVFNLTFTHSFKADMAYTLYLSRQCVRNHQQYEEYQSMDYTVNKTRATPIAWMVSICRTQSRREDYVKELEKHIAVDVYGGCGDLKCGSNNLSTWEKDNCDAALFNDRHSYQFYLAFENSLCEDYVSEKLWRLLKMNIVPIVLGAVDYSTILPKDTYINARDFRSPKELADFLKGVMSDKDVYNGYIRRKNALACHATVPYMPKQCFLCKRLHEIHSMKRERIVHDLSAMYGKHHCIDPRNIITG